MYEIRKDPNYYMKWQLWRDGTFIERNTRKRTIVILKQLYEDDLTNAPEWYRLSIKDAEKKMSNKQAIRYAIMCAQRLGLLPEHVHADPRTGDPLP